MSGLRGRGKCKAEAPRAAWGVSASNRSRLYSSSSEQPEESEGSASKSHSGRGPTKKGWTGRKSGPSGSPKRPPRNLDLSPRRSPRLRNIGAAESVRRLPLTAKPSRDRVAYTSASEDKQGRHRSQSSCSSSEGERAARSSPHPDPVPTELGKSSLSKFTLVSYTKDSTLFTSTNPHLPG